MKTFILSISLFSSLMLKGQDCDYVKNEVDEFSNNIYISTEAKLNSNSKMQFLFKDKEYLLWYYFPNNTLESLKIELSDSIIFKFTNGEILSAFPVKAIEEKKVNILGTFVKYIDPSYKFNEDKLTKLSQNNVDKIRVFFGGKKIDIELKEKFSERIKISATCLLTGVKESKK